MRSPQAYMVRLISPRRLYIGVARTHAARRDGTASTRAMPSKMMAMSAAPHSSRVCEVHRMKASAAGCEVKAPCSPFDVRSS